MGFEPSIEVLQDTLGSQSQLFETLVEGHLVSAYRGCLNDAVLAREYPLLELVDEGFCQLPGISWQKAGLTYDALIRRTGLKISVGKRSRNLRSLSLGAFTSFDSNGVPFLTAELTVEVYELGAATVAYTSNSKISRLDACRGVLLAPIGRQNEEEFLKRGAYDFSQDKKCWDLLGLTQLKPSFDELVGIAYQLLRPS